MTTLTIQIAEDRLEQLKEVARREGVEPEELVRARLEEWLSNRPTDFDQAAKYVLDKNKELYRRLS